MARTNASIQAVSKSSQLWAVVVILIPIGPFHLVVKAHHCDIEFLHVRVKDLARSLCWVAQSFFPAVKPLFLDGVLKLGGQIVLHVTFKTDRPRQHIAMFGHMSNAFARCTLDVRQKRSAIAVLSGQATCSTLVLAASPCQSSIVQLWAFTTYLVVVVAVSTTKAIVVGHSRAAARMFIPTKSVSPRQPLDLGVVSIEYAAGGEELIVKNPTYAWGDNVPETSLRILVNTGRKSMETKVRREVATVVFLYEQVHMRLEGSDSIRIFRE